jgi:HEAT repeat protein
LQTGVRGLIVIVACCGLITWAARSVWETEHPAIAAARGLDSPEPSARARAIRELMTAGEADPGRSIPPLVAALGDAVPEVRVAAAQALGAIGGNAARVGSAGDAIGLAIAGLIRSLKDPEPAVRIVATTALVPIAYGKGSAGGGDGPSVIDALAGMLGDREDQVRRAALEALALCGPLGPSDPPSALMAALEDRSASCRASAFKALSRFPCPLDPWLPLLLRSVEREEPEVRAACWNAFARDRRPAFSPGAIPALMTALESRKWIVRFCAARALEPHARDPRATVAIPALLKLLKAPINPGPGEPGIPPGASPGPSGDPAHLAAGLLGKLAPGTTTAGEVIADLTEGVRSSQPHRRYFMIDALAEFGAAAEPAVPALIQVLREGLGSERGRRFFDGYWVGRALARIAPGTGRADEAVTALMEALRADRPDLRAVAVDALGAFGAAAEPAVPLLIQALRGPRLKDEGVLYRPSVARALGRIAPGTRSADAALAALTEALDSDPETRLGVVDALSAFGPRAAGILPRLRAWQGDKDARLGTAATSALKAIEGAEAGHQGGDGDESKGPE